MGLINQNNFSSSFVMIGFFFTGIFAFDLFSNALVFYNLE